MQKTAGNDRPAPAYPIASVDNALRLLLLFREQHQIRLSDASDYLGVANSTAHRLLAMLVHHQFVDQEPSQRTYVPGPALVEIGLATVRRMDVRTSARPVLEALAARSGETALLSRLDGAMALCLDSVESSKALRVASQAELLLPAHCSASGKALLAELPTGELRALFPRGARLVTVTPTSIRSFRALEAELAAVRGRGYATTSGESEEGLGAIAAVAHDARGRAVAAFSVSAPVFRLDARRTAAHTQHVLDAARELTGLFAAEAQLGH